MKNVVIAGASGMVGSLILKKSLSSSSVIKVTSLVRRKTTNQHPKLNEVIVDNFADYSTQGNVFHNVDTAFFCIGVYTGQVPDDAFRKITIDYAVAFAEALKTRSPAATLCFLSGAGADRTEKSRMAFAKYKGIAENKISELDLGHFHTFRPGYIYPVQARIEPTLGYRIMRTMYPLIRRMGANSSIKSTDLAAAMFRVGVNGSDTEILENKDILQYT